jgi:hypothetical protein
MTEDHPVVKFHRGVGDHPIVKLQKELAELSRQFNEFKDLILNGPIVLPGEGLEQTGKYVNLGNKPRPKFPDIEIINEGLGPK